MFRGLLPLLVAQGATHRRRHEVLELLVLGLHSPYPLHRSPLHGLSHTADQAEDSTVCKTIVHLFKRPCGYLSDKQTYQANPRDVNTYRELYI